MPSYQETIARGHTVRLEFEDGAQFECMRQSGLFDLEDNTFEHTILEAGTSAKAMVLQLPSGRHKIGQVTLTLIQNESNPRAYFSNMQLNHQRTSFKYTVVDYEGVIRDSATASDVKVIHSKLNDTDRNSDEPITCEVILSVGGWD